MNAWHGLSLQANYVWSHSIDNASDLEDFIPNAAQPNNSWNTKAERGNSNFDIRNRFSLNFTYQLPKFDGEYAKLKNGWGIDGVLNLQDGQPFNFNYNFQGDYSGSGEGFDRPDVVGPIHYGSTPANFLDLTSFAVPCTFGNTTANLVLRRQQLPCRFAPLRQPGTQLTARPVFQGVQLLGVQRHAAHRARAACNFAPNSSTSSIIPTSPTRSCPTSSPIPA